MFFVQVWYSEQDQNLNDDSASKGKYKAIYAFLPCPKKKHIINEIKETMNISPISRSHFSNSAIF